MPRLAKTAARGYGADHQARRAALAPTVNAGHATCWRCGLPILPGQAWDLGHDDHDRSIYRGPEHRRRTGGCPGNRAAGAVKGNRARGQRRRLAILTTPAGILRQPPTAARW